MEQKEMKSFKEYAQSGETSLHKSKPPLMEKETTFIFVHTLLKPYYEKMIGNAMQNFVKMVWLGELIEHGIKNKKIEGKSTPTSSAKKTNLVKKKERYPHHLNQPTI